MKWKDLPLNTSITGIILHVPKRVRLDQGIPKNRMIIFSGWFRGLWLKTDNKSERIYPLTLKGESFDEINEWIVEQKG